MRRIILSSIVFICLAKNNANAQYWSALGEGIGNWGGEGKVYTMAMYQGDLYAAGGQVYNDTGWSARIVKWNGSNWLTIGEAMNGSDVWINSLLVFNDELYVAGAFSSINGVPANGIAKWNGSGWSPFGSGIGSATAPLIVFNYELYAAGATGVVKWNGTTWVPVGNLLMDYIYSFAVYDGELYATGIYYNANNSSYYDIAKWDGTNWIPLNSQPNEGAWINTMIEFNGELYVGGNFSSIGGIAANHIAKWNGTNWAAVGIGLGVPGSTINQVFSLTIHNNGIYAAGFFTITDSTSCKNIAKWDGTNWIGLGIGLGQDFEEEVYAIISDDTVIYAGGNFHTAGNVSARNIAKWTDSCITAPAQPTNIIGEIISCHHSFLTFSVNPVNDASSYTWTLPAGWDGSSISNSIEVSTGTNGGTISVTANNSCGNSPIQTLDFTVRSNPIPPDFISGDDKICENTPETYLINPIPGATSYTWSIPAGWWVQAGGSGWSSGSTPFSIISSANSIAVKANAKSGTISVTANNDCGSSGHRDISITVVPMDTAPLQPGSINGNSISGIGQTLTYSIAPINGATDYNWSLLSGGIITTGQHSNSITVKWETTGRHTLSVKASNNCITGSELQKAISVITDGGIGPYALKLFPNPASGEFYLKANGVQDKWLSVEVVSMSGQLMYRSGKILGSNNYFMLIDMDKMAPGLFVVKIIVDDQVFTEKIAIVR